jgi:hypothetical protein
MAVLQGFKRSYPMPCKLCRTYMHFLGMDDEGKQYFECHQDNCERQYKPTRRWWESGTSFHEEEVPLSSVPTK